MKDYFAKKPTKAETEKAEVDKKEQEANQKFMADFQQFQKDKNRMLAAVIIHDLKGSHIEFTSIPYQEPK